MNKGDVVQLKSGGPSMTVSDVRGAEPNEQVTCSFFDGAGEMDTATLPAVCLKPANEKTKRFASLRPWSSIRYSVLLLLGRQGLTH